MELLNYFLNNWIECLTVLGFLISLISLCDHFHKSHYQLGYLKEDSWPLIVDDLLEKDFQIKYKGKFIKNIYRIKYRIFNQGDQSLRKEDLYHQYFKITSKGVIFDARIMIRNSNGNFKLKKISKAVYKLMFDFFDSNQIIDLDILTSVDNVELECSAVGMQQIKEFQYPRFDRGDIMQMIPIFLLTTIGFFGLYFKQNKSIAEWIFLYMLGSTLLYAVMSILGSIRHFYERCPKREVLKYKFVKKK